MSSEEKTIAVVGGGLVGALNACFFAQRGFQVHLYEARSDIRKQEVVKGRSINLALSKRGRDALRAVGLEERVVEQGVPMRARMIHDTDGSRRPIPYGTKEQYIMSVDRRKLNELLLDAAEASPNVTLHFDHKLLSCDFNKKKVVFQHGEDDEAGEASRVERDVDMIVGCDGAYSAVRRQVMKATMFDFSQEYIPHGYLELTMPPTTDGQFSMETNYLHIWPRNTFMLIALPDPWGKRFVVTLFIPYSEFNAVKDDDDADRFFDTHFPDAVPLIGRTAIREAFKRPLLPLVSIKCRPYHVPGSCVMMGDAVHAMVPFYGQGMNCGFEDCLIFDELLDKFNNDFGQAMEEFTNYRNVDAKAICDLAMYNYIEMREKVNSRLFLLRKFLDNLIYFLLPRVWVPLYTSVSFTRIRYHECIRNKSWQDQVLRRVAVGAGLVGIVAFISGACWWSRAHPGPISQILPLSTRLSGLIEYFHW